MRYLNTPLIAGSAALILTGAATVGPSAAATRSVTPAKTIKASPITRFPKTLAPGTKVKSSQLGQRVFVDATHGFALAAGAQAQYSAATTDGGRTWRTDSPALHVAAAQAPLAVQYLGVANRRTAYAYGGGQVVDVTSDGGKMWRRALFNGLVMAVVPTPQGDLVTFVDASANASGANGPTWQYVSKDGGRSWRYTTRVGGS